MGMYKFSEINPRRAREGHRAGRSVWQHSSQPGEDSILTREGHLRGRLQEIQETRSTKYLAQRGADRLRGGSQGIQGSILEARRRADRLREQAQMRQIRDHGILEARRRADRLREQAQMRQSYEVSKVSEEEIKEALAPLIAEDLSRLNEALAPLIAEDLSRLNEAFTQLKPEDLSRLNEAFTQLKPEDLSKLDKVQEIWDKIADSNTQEVISYGMEKLAEKLENRLPQISDPMLKLAQLWILKHVVTLFFDILNGEGIKLLRDVIDLVSDIYGLFNPVWAAMKAGIALVDLLTTRNEIGSVQEIQPPNELP